MPLLDFLLRLCFWTCLVGIFYAYVGYPLVLSCLSWWFRRPPPTVEADEHLPTLSLLIAAYNEEAVIEERILNALALDYPPDKLQIVIACDGCSDATPQIVAGYAQRGVRLLNYAERQGKASTLNAALAVLEGDIVMLSDANTTNDPMAARKLARWFRDPDVGVVCGRLILTDPASGRNVDSLYWRYETLLKEREGRLGAMPGANGGIYAIRRDLLLPIGSNTIVDDMVIPLTAKLRTGCRIVYDPDAVAHEETPASVGAEFHRRARIGAGGFQCLVGLRGLLHPRHGWIAFTFFSHKALRWLCPFFLLGAFASNVLLTWEGGIYPLVLLAQIGFYTFSLALAYCPGRGKPLRLLRLSTLFVSMNAALLVGFWRWLRGTQKAAWKRTVRDLEAPRAVRPADAPQTLTHEQYA